MFKPVLLSGLSATALASLLAAPAAAQTSNATTTNRGREIVVMAACRSSSCTAREAISSASRTKEKPRHAPGQASVSPRKACARALRGPRSVPGALLVGGLGAKVPVGGLTDPDPVRARPGCCGAMWNGVRDSESVAGPAMRSKSVSNARDELHRRRPIHQRDVEADDVDRSLASQRMQCITRHRTRRNSRLAAI